MEEKQKVNKKTVVKYAGAFVAWLIGSGFATGQEILQFFTSFGYMSYGAVLINLAGTLYIGKVLLTTGYDHREEEGFNQFKYFCGEKLGAFYSVLIIITLLFIMPVLNSGAGATLSEYYGMNHYVGSLIMALMVLSAYLIGFERLVKVVSSIGPLIIIFSVTVGIITVTRDYSAFGEVGKFATVLSSASTSPNWVISGILYISLNFLSGSTYFVQLGISADSRREAKYGALLGAGAFILAIAIMNTAILLNAGEVAALAIPILCLAKKMSYIFGAVFSVILILGIFSASSAMMWTVCSKITKDGTRGGKKGNVIAAVCVSLFTFAIGCFSFSGLIGFLYPFVGYIGLVYVACVIGKQFKRK